MGISIGELLDELQDISSDDEKSLEGWCEELGEFYEENPRHSYSELTKYIVSLDGGVEYMDRILPVLKKVKARLEGKRPDMAKSVEKLMDHIQLETIRIRYTRHLVEEIAQQKCLESLNTPVEGIEELRDSYGKLARELEGRKAELQKDIESHNKTKAEIQTLSESLKSTSETAERAVKKIQMAESHSITILGIFASVVLAFVGGLAFSSSVLQNIGNASIYKIVLVSCGIAAVLINLIYLLLRFIREINQISGETERYPQYLRRLMFGIGVIVLLDVAAWFLGLHQLAAAVHRILYG